MTTISLAYVLLAISIIEFIFFFYYKFLVINTSDKSKKRDKIIGTMKDPEDWRRRNNIMAFVSLAWAIISVIAFIYLKFFSKSELISTIYVFVYIALIASSVALFLKTNKVVRGK